MIYLLCSDSTGYSTIHTNYATDKEGICKIIGEYIRDFGEVAIDIQVDLEKGIAIVEYKQEREMEQEYTDKGTYYIRSIENIDTQL